VFCSTCLKRHPVLTQFSCYWLELPIDVRSALYRSQHQPSSLNQSLAAVDKPLVIEDYYCVAVKQQPHSSRRHSHTSSDDTAAAADATTTDDQTSDAANDSADSSSNATITATTDGATVEATKPAVKLVTALTPPRSPVYEGEDGAARWLVNTHSPPHSSSAAAAACGSTPQNSTMQLLQQMEACGDSDSDSDADGAIANSAVGMSASVFGRYGLGRFALPKPIDIELEPVAVTGSSLGISKFAASSELQQHGGSDSLYDFTSTTAAAVAATAVGAAAAAAAATGTTVAAAAAAAPSLVMPFMSFTQSSAGLQRAGEASASAATTGLFSAGFTSSDVIEQQQQQQQQQQYRFDEHTQSQHEQLLLDLARSNSSSSIDSRSSSDSVDGTAAGDHGLLPFGAVTGLAATTAGTTAMQQQLADIVAMDWLTGVQSDALHSAQLAQAVTATGTAGLFDGAAEGNSAAVDTTTAADTADVQYCSDPFAELTAQLQQQQQVDGATPVAATSTATTAVQAAGSSDASSGDARSAGKALPVACLIDTSEPEAELNTAATPQQELPFAGTL
jgi:hypothetical protein